MYLYCTEEMLSTSKPVCLRREVHIDRDSQYYNISWEQTVNKEIVLGAFIDM
jgi:hypothetical protein